MILVVPVGHGCTPRDASWCNELGALTALRRRLAAHLEVVEQVLGRGGDRGDGLLERLGVVAGRRAEPADLADVLKRGGPHVGVGHLLGVGLSECLDAAAHASRRYASQLAEPRSSASSGRLP